MKRLKDGNFSIIAFAFLLLIFISNSFAQNSKCKNASAETDDDLMCANELVEFAKLHKVKQMQGRVLINKAEYPLLGVIDIYVVSKLDAKSLPSDLVKQLVPFKRFKTNERGEFCLTGIAEGDYVLKVGTSEGGFNCTWLKVKVTKSGSKKPIEIGLTLGT